MESRFRVRFWHSRRARTNEDLDLHSVPYQDATEGRRKPVFIYQPLGRNLNEKRKSQILALQGHSYHTSKAGPPPEVGELPHKGNGPIKIQASQRAISRASRANESDFIVNDFRTADYFDVGNEKRDSRSLPGRNSSLGERRPSYTSLSSSPAQRHPPASAPPAWAPFGSSPLLDIPENSISHLPTQTPLTPPLSSSNTTVLRRSSSQQASPPYEGLGISEASYQPQSILKNGGHSSYVEPPPEQNATIRALWKAEYSRLVSMYGQSGVDKSFGDVPWEPKKRSSVAEAISSIDSPPRQVPLDPLPRPDFEGKDNAVQRRTSRHSRQDGNEDNTSDESSHRPTSFMSSAGGYASSYTTRTSFADSETVNTKEDIRKIVESMRTTYIQALESREPSMQAVKAMKRKKKSKSTTPSGTPRVSSIPATPEAERVSHVSTNPSPPIRSQRSTRVVSQPVAGIPTAAAIDSSPQRTTSADTGLQRADSATLGVLMGESKRASIQKRLSKQHSRRSSIQNPKIRKSSSLSRKASSTCKENVTSVEIAVMDEDFASMYKDIFNASSFWESSPLDATPKTSPPLALGSSGST